MSHCHVDELLVGVWAVAQRGNFCAILDSSEEDFRGISSRVRAAKERVIGFEGGRGGFAIDRAELVKDHDRCHARMPPVYAGQI